MGKNTCSKVSIVALLLCILLIYPTKSALRSRRGKLSVTGRRMIADDMETEPEPGGGIETPPSRSRPGQKGRRLMTYYKPNADIFTGPSNSGHGGGNIDNISFP